MSVLVNESCDSNPHASPSPHNTLELGIVVNVFVITFTPGKCSVALLTRYWLDLSRLPRAPHLTNRI